MPGNATVTVQCPNIDKEITYSMDIDLRKSIDKQKSTLRQQDRDFVLVVDGSEGSGKSTLAIQIGKYYDPTLDLSRIVFTAEEFREAIYKAPRGTCIIFDEAFVGLSSRTALSKINKMLVSLMMQMRQKNLFVILVMPSFFLLDKYAALFRSKLLINVYEVKGVRGYFQMFNKKDKKTLFLTEAKYYSYSKVKTYFRGRFYGKFALGKRLEEKYRQKKEKALIESEKAEESTPHRKYFEQRNTLLGIMYKDLKIKAPDIEKLCLSRHLELSRRQINSIVKAFKGKNGERK